MDELEWVRDLYGEPPPNPAAKTRVRRRLDARRSRRRRMPWMMPLAGAVATLAAVLLTYGVTGGADRPHDPARDIAAGRGSASGGPTTGPSTGSGRSVLLAAATTAASDPVPRGAYWRVTRRTGGKTTTLWAARDGRAWITGPDADAVPRPVTKPFTMAGRALSLRDIERLPTGTDALRRRVAALLPPGSGEGLLADAVSGLLWSKPSPPAVRAAAYRLLADLPNVRYLGQATDPTGRPGRLFAFTLDASGAQRHLVIDPVSSQVLSSSDGADGGGRNAPAGRDEIVLAAGWTDDVPPP
ncbi:CU044_5270 family protein [Streptosporangium sandarakinum]